MGGVRRLVSGLGIRLVRTLGLRRVAPRSVSDRTPLFKSSNLNLSSVSTLRVVLVLREGCKVGVRGPTGNGRVFCSMHALTSCVATRRG